MLRLSFFALLLACFFFSNQAFSWGPTGHRAVGKVAEIYLSKSKLKKVRKLLNGESLARASNWPDKIKSDPENYSHTYPWHYTSWPVGQTDYHADSAGGSLPTAIANNVAILKNKSKGKHERAKALKFIVHLVGDLHQPLHVGNGEDRGGNDCKVYFHRELVNLHRLWDEAMIRFSRLSYTELADFVIDTHKKDVKLVKKGNLNDWMRESKILREQVYPKEVVPEKGPEDGLKSFTIPTTGSHTKKYCKKDLQLPDREIPRLSYPYSYKFMPILERRIFEAGVRLAKIIDQSL